MYLKKKLPMSYLIVVLIPFLVIIYSLFSIGNVGENVKEITEITPIIDASMGLKNYIRKDMNVVLEIIEIDKDAFENLWDKHLRQKKGFTIVTNALLHGQKNKNLGSIKKIKNKRMRKEIENVNNLYQNKIIPIMKNIHNLKQKQFKLTEDESDKFEDKLSKLEEKIDNQKEKITELVSNIEKNAKKEMQSIVKSSSKYVSTAKRNSLIGLFLAFIISIILAFKISSSITKPLIRIVEVSKNISEGDLNQEIKLYREDEIGDMANSLRNMLDYLKGDIALKNKIIASSKTPLFAIDTEFNILEVNLAAASLNNKTPEELKGSKCYDLFKTGNCNTSNCALAKAMKSGNSETGRTISRPSPNKELSIVYSASPLVNNENNIMGAVSVITDITSIADAQKDVSKVSNLLSNSIKEMTNMVKEVFDKTNSLTLHSNTVSDIALGINNSMDTVSSSIEESQSIFNSISSATEEMTLTISEIAKNSENARGITEDVTSNMDNINTKLLELKKASEDIQSVTEIISGIANQTNLLALNATIEAARAGEAGRGFAVVANEIKKLASQTNKATSEIKNKIDNITNTSMETVENISRTSNIIFKMNEIVLMIATAIEEQTVTTSEIAKNINFTNDSMVKISQNTSNVTKSSNDSYQNILDMNSDLIKVSTLMTEFNKKFTELNQANITLSESVDKLNE